jgi:hypothetical protein
VRLKRTVNPLYLSPDQQEKLMSDPLLQAALDSDEFFNHAAAEMTFSLMLGSSEATLWQSMRDCAQLLLDQGELSDRKTADWFATDFLNRV